MEIFFPPIHQPINQVSETSIQTINRISRNR